MNLNFATLLFALCCLLPSCTAYTCIRHSGSLSQIDVGVGQVIGVNGGGHIYTRIGNWVSIPGRLNHGTVGPAGIWGINGNIIMKYLGTTWVTVPGTLKQIDAGGNQFVVGVSDEDIPMCLQKENTVDIIGADSDANWMEIPGSLKYYSCGPYNCWGVNKHDQIFVRRGVNSSHCQGEDWKPIPGSLSMVEVGGDGSVFGVDSNGKVYRRDSTSACKPEGTGWTHLPIHSGNVKHVSYDVGHLWIILKNQHIYDCTL